MATLLCLIAFAPATAPVAADNGRFADPAPRLHGPGLAAAVETLSQWPTRMTGTPGAAAAADYLAARLDAAGADWVARHAFEVAVPSHDPLQLTWDGASHGEAAVALYPLWPNGHRLAGVPSRGLDGAMVYGGSGSLDELAGLDLGGALVALEFGHGDNWLNPFLLGAAAVVFLEPADGQASRRAAEAAFVTAPADLPRFWLPEPGAEELRDALQAGDDISGHLAGEARWEAATGENVVAYLEGADPQLRDEVLVIAAPYDATSVVPGLAPGAEQALSPAVLLELADYFAAHRPGRSVVFLATAGHGQGLAGIRAFIENQVRIHGSGSSPQAVGTVPRDDTLTDYLGTHIRAVRFIELSLRSDSDQLGLFHQGHFIEEVHELDVATVQYRPDRFRFFGQFFSSAAQTVLADGDAAGAYFVDTIGQAADAAWDGSLPSPRAFDAEAVTLAGGAGLTFATLGSQQQRLDTPHDRVEHVDMANVHVQAELLVRLLSEAASSPALPAPSAQQDDLFHFLQLQAEGAEPAAGEVLLFSVGWGHKTVAGVRGQLIELAGSDHGAFIAGMPSAYMLTEVDFDAFIWEQGTGRLSGYLYDLAAAGGPVDSNVPFRLTQADPLVMARGAAATLAGMPPSTAGGVTLTDSSGTELASYRYLQDGPIGVAMTPSDGPHFVVTAAAARGGEAFRLSLASDEDPQGQGFAAGESMRIGQLPWLAAQDMRYLTAARLLALDEGGITLPALLHDHRMVERLLAQSGEHLAAGDHTAFYGTSLRAQQLAGNLLPRVAEISIDADRVLTYYLLLAVPFAYFLGRILGADAGAGRRLLLAGGAYLAIFAILYLVHPAFAIGTGVPYETLYAIGIGLAVLVAYYRWGGMLDRWIARLRPRRHGVGNTKPQPLPAIASAFNLGIENIARRRSRSFLTALTIALLLLAMMSIVALQPHLGHEQQLLEGSPMYEGFLLRADLGDPVPPETLAQLHDWYQGSLAVSERLGRTVSNSQFWDSPRPYTSFQQRPNRLVGVDPQPLGFEPESLLIRGRWPAAGEHGIVYPIGMLDADEAAEVLLDVQVQMFGQQLTIVGIFDHNIWGALTDIDGQPLSLSLRHVSLPDPGFADNHRTLLMRPETAALLGSVPYAVTMQRLEDDDPHVMAEELAAVFQHDMFVGTGDERLRVRPARLAVSELAGPFGVMALIGGLIILNVMISAVSERTRELKIYGSIGMAPAHVSALLFAEALVFAVLGVGAGYLAVQLMSKGMALTGVLPGVTLNVASGEAVFMAGVMVLMVMLSTIYPAIMARRIAAPGYEPVWKVGEPEDGAYLGALPFYVREGQELGINVFMVDYLEVQNQGGGDFFLRSLELFPLLIRGEMHGYAVQFVVHLPPFDLGVNQLVRLETVHLGEGQYQVGYEIRHLSGEQNAWTQRNQVFMRQLRRQYLLWNTLDDETRLHYRDKGLRWLEEEGDRVVRLPREESPAVPPGYDSGAARTPVAARQGTYRAGRADGAEPDALRQTIAEHLESERESS